MKKTLFLLLYFGLSILCAQVDAATIKVPQDYTTIQVAINAASSGDTVLVSSGTYYGQIIMKSGVTLKSENGPQMTILDGEGDTVLYAYDWDDADGFHPCLVSPSVVL